MTDFDFSAPTDGTPKRPGPPVGQLVFGVGLLVIGTLWLLASLDIASVSWRAVLAVLLLLVGVALLALSRTGAHGGLVAIGVVLTVMLSLASTAEGLFDIPFSGGIGDRVERPESLVEDPGPYRLAIGQLTVDLTAANLPAGETIIEASVGIGDLELRLPPGVPIEIRGRVGAGQVSIEGGPDWSGTGVDEVFRDDGFSGAATRIVVDARVGLGQIEVRR